MRQETPRSSCLRAETIRGHAKPAKKRAVGADICFIVETFFVISLYT